MNITHHVAIESDVVAGGRAPLQSGAERGQCEIYGRGLEQFLPEAPRTATRSGGESP